MLVSPPLLLQRKIPLQFAKVNHEGQESESLEIGSSINSESKRLLQQLENLVIHLIYIRLVAALI